MDRVKFVKYQGTGNDFILIEDLYGHFPIQDQEFISILCDRHFGIGADGLVLCQNSSTADFRMRYFNSDGAEATMCGNALRCLVAFLRDHAMVEKTCKIETAVGIHGAELLEEGKIAVSLSRPALRKVYKDFYQGGDAYHVFSGVDHLVLMAQDLSRIDLQADGEKFRYDRRFRPSGVNVNFVSYVSGKTFFMRTYEKGVESETLSCGTGAIAAAFVLREKLGASVELVQFASEEILEFSFEIQRVWLKGKVNRVFEGLIIPKKSKNPYDPVHQHKMENMSYANRYP